MPYAQFAATSQFFLYGKRHFTKTGYESHKKSQGSAALDVMSVDLTGKKFIVTGANSGCGKELTKYLGGRGATVFMICRSEARAEAAKQDILREFAGAKLEILLGDVGTDEDVRRLWSQYSEKNDTLDGIVLNAGTLLNTKQLTKEGVEVTLATHLLFGVFLLGSLAMPTLAKSVGRCLIVTSAGMLQYPFPEWEVAASLKGTYDGTARYSQMKRGQVILASKWAAQHSDVKIVSVHPGWAKTAGTDEAFGEDMSKYFEPWRSTWEGIEGMAWLLCCPLREIESGAFYLDRSPQAQHMAGPFFTEGSYTKNSPEEIAAMMEKLESWTSGGIPSPDQLTAISEAVEAGSVAAKSKCQPLDRPLDLKKFMGKWYIIGSIPSFLDKDTANGTEEYVWDEEKQRIAVTFTYMSSDLKKTSTMPQTAKPVNENKTSWELKLKLGPIPVKLSYLIIGCDLEDYSTCIVGDPGRNLLYLMARSPAIEPAVYESMKLEAEAAGYDRFKIQDQPQTWPLPAGSGYPQTDPDMVRQSS
jgi:dehydrogenase/reductase SDR family protein 12